VFMQSRYAFTGISRGQAVPVDALCYSDAAFPHKALPALMH